MTEIQTVFRSKEITKEITMTTVQDTTDKLEFVNQWLNRTRSSLLLGDDNTAYYHLGEAQHELTLARLYVAESEARDEIVRNVVQNLELATYAVAYAIDALLGKPHNTYKAGSDLVRTSPDRAWVLLKVTEARGYLLTADNMLSIELLSDAPLSTHMRILEDDGGGEEHEVGI